MPAKPVPVANPTPAPEPVQDKSGVHDAAPRKVIVDDYPERPYSEAISPEHLEVLRELGQEPK